jgi:hypothetical protein
MVIWNSHVWFTILIYGRIIIPLDIVLFMLISFVKSFYNFLSSTENKVIHHAVKHRTDHFALLTCVLFTMHLLLISESIFFASYYHL